MYRSALEGIDSRLNTRIEDGFTDPFVFECFVAEAAIQHLMDGGWVDPVDVKRSFQHEKWRETVLQYCRQYGIR